MSTSGPFLRSGKRVASVVLGCFPNRKNKTGTLPSPHFLAMKSIHTVGLYEQRSHALATTVMHLDGGKKSALK